ncbi:hypothetical protein AB1Y20_004571 [Prymnesium parvum]|uniref:Glycosyltransferase family 92 protein n=1 Tax=Prymnesium parvum TaxID=97485 RepID=A0AB34IXV9_PRYPA
MACGCSLRFLRPQLYLTSFTSADLARLLPHFVEHYASCVGVRLDHMHIFVDDESGGPAAAAARDLLLAAGVPRSGVELVRRAVAFTWDWARARINRWIVRLPQDAWVINADGDEFFAYPCDMPLRARVFHSFCAEMTDRVSSDGTVAEVAASPPLASQFPHKCYFRQNIRRSMNRQKIVLMRGRDRYWYDVDKELEVNAKNRPPHPYVFEGKVIVRQFENAHRTYLQFGRGRCNHIGEFAHYTMTKEQLHVLQRGSLKANHPDPYARKDYAAMRAIMLRHLPNSSNDLRMHPFCPPPRWYTANSSSKK